MNLNPARASTDASPTVTDHGRASVPRLDTDTVFGACREVILVHRGQEYRLRITRAGKLILTK